MILKLDDCISFLLVVFDVKVFFLLYCSIFRLIIIEYGFNFGINFLRFIMIFELN